MCHQLIGSHILILFFKAEIVPGHISCLIDIAALHVRIFQSHGWEMVAVENDDGFFISFGQVFDQIADKLIDF